MAERENKRQSNIELLRILAMLMIIAHHFAVHAGFDFPTNAVTANREFVHWLDLGGKIGVNLFVLISGYFMIQRKTLKVKKVLRLWGQIWFSCVVLYLVTCCLGIHPFSVTPAVELLAPVTFGQWWFATTYFTLFLLSPYINRGLATLDKQQYRILLALMTFLWCLTPTFARQDGEGGEFTWFVYLYCLAGYLRLYPEDLRLKTRTCLLLATGIMVLELCWAVLFDYLGIFVPGAHWIATRYFGMSQLPILVISVLLFWGFLNWDLGYHPWINTLASAAFGVYLIHDSFYTREFLWKQLFRNAAFSQSPILIPYAAGVILLVYVVCAGLELLRIATVEKLWMKAVDRLEEKWAAKKKNAC